MKVGSNLKKKSAEKKRMSSAEKKRMSSTLAG